MNNHATRKLLNLGLTLLIGVGIAALGAGCAAPQEDPGEGAASSVEALRVDGAESLELGEDGEVPPSEEALRGGGCSMAEIHQAQDLCAIFSFPRRSRGIHSCSHDSGGSVTWSCA